jgi:uncharacterized protein
MFIEFQVGNYRSFRDIQKFSMQASPLRSNDNGLEEGNVFESSDFRLLKSKAVYGSNASGKSNLITALSYFNRMVDKSVTIEGIPKTIWENSFKLITDWENEPVFFQYIFLNEGLIYRYGFQILNEKIIYEWLFEGQKENEKEFFMRGPSGLNINKENFIVSSEFINQTNNEANELYRYDSLFLTAAALNGNSIAAKLRNHIKEIAIIDGMNDEEAIQFGMRKLLTGTEDEKKAIKSLLNAGDTGIEDLELVDDANYDFDNHPAPIIQPHTEKVLIKKAAHLYSSHSRYDENGQLKDKISVSFGHWESEGTKKLFSIGAFVLDSLKKGEILIIDEFDARFHPNLTLKIVELFNSKKTNPHNAQIIFVTHDTGLLRRAELRRDQICLVNKDKYGISTLSTLVEFKGVRKDASYEKEYLNGNYSAVPYLDNMDSVITQNSEGNGL